MTTLEVQNEVFDINQGIDDEVTLTQLQEDDIDDDKDHGKGDHGHGHHHHHHHEIVTDPDDPHDKDEYFDRIMK